MHLYVDAFMCTIISVFIGIFWIIPSL